MIRYVSDTTPPHAAAQRSAAVASQSAQPPRGWVIKRILSIALCAALAAPAVFAQEPTSTPKRGDGLAKVPNQVRGDEITQDCKLAVEKGLAWLAARQAQNGGYSGM